MSDALEEYQKERGVKRWDELCEHMRALIVHCETVGVQFGGCGDCGSPWLECGPCKETVGDAAEAFYR